MNEKLTSRVKKLTWIWMWLEGGSFSCLLIFDPRRILGIKTSSSSHLRGRALGSMRVLLTWDFAPWKAFHASPQRPVLCCPGVHFQQIQIEETSLDFLGVFWRLLYDQTASTTGQGHLQCRNKTNLPQKLFDWYQNDILSCFAKLRMKFPRFFFFSN